VVAGYFGGWIDDLIQYLYTVLASIRACCSSSRS
jgi:ABC-type dipeptide/oligopeptide/nickel transport system permease subunit